MKTDTSICFILFIVLSSFSAQNYALDDSNYCYKPSKPLLFSTAKTKTRYIEDEQEYQRCQQSFAEMQEREAKIRKEAELNSRLFYDAYIKNNHVKTGRRYRAYESID